MSRDSPILLGVAGFPVGHSMSPVLHAHWLQQNGINGYYVPVEVKRIDFPDVLRSLPKMGFKGLNVTVPHKEAVLQFSNSISDEAALIGAANTLAFREDGMIYADNTDGHGFLQNLRSSIDGWSAAAGPALLFGAGGAARAVIHALLSDGAPEIHLINRTRQRAELLREQFGNRVRIRSLVDTSALLPDAALVVNTTSMGMHGKPKLELPFGRAGKGLVATDLVYNPLETAFLADARQAGCIVVDGLGMLLHQAAASFRFWHGVWPSVDEEVRQLTMPR